jgi:hypothetical protein
LSGLGVLVVNLCGVTQVALEDVATHVKAIHAQILDQFDRRLDKVCPPVRSADLLE